MYIIYYDRQRPARSSAAEAYSRYSLLSTRTSYYNILPICRTYRYPPAVYYILIQGDLTSMLTLIFLLIDSNYDFWNFKIYLLVKTIFLNSSEFKIRTSIVSQLLKCLHYKDD